MDVVIVGGGLAGVATAYHLKKEHAARIKRITIIERLDKPLGQLTSSRSTECYRNAWPEPVMMAFVNHSISLLEDMDKASNGAFEMNRPGYLFVTSKASNTYSEQGKYAESIGIGTFREHLSNISSYTQAPGTNRTFRDPSLLNLNGVDVIKRKEDLHALYPFLGDDIVAGKHVRKCGWITVQSLIDWMCSSSGATVKHDSVVQITPTSSGARLLLASDEVLDCDKVVLALGPHLVNLASMLSFGLGYNIPLINEIHAKVVIDDAEAVVPESSPLVHLDDDILLEWSADQREFISSKPELAYLLKPIRYGAHFRPGPVGSKELWGIWTFPEASAIEIPNQVPHSPTVDPYYGEVVLRGMTAMIPGLKKYWNPNANPMTSTNKFIKGVVSGHYCKTPENRPVIGPLQDNIIVVGALSGFGIMSCVAAGQLAASYVVSSSPAQLPEYAAAFRPDRFADVKYLESLAELAKKSGQL